MADPELPASHPRANALAARLRAQLPLKLAVCLGLAVGICVPYFLLQNHSVLPPRTVPRTPLDGWIGFGPGWVWAYESIAVLVPLAVLLATRRQELLRYAQGLALLCTISFVTFLVFPVVGPRPEVPPEHAMYAALVALDAPLNSFPSLHAGLTAYSLLFAYRAFGPSLDRRGRRVLAGLAWIWAGAILYGTLATKQHWAVDLPPGLLAGWLGHRFAWRLGRLPDPSRDGPTGRSA